MPEAEITSAPSSSSINNSVATQNHGEDNSESLRRTSSSNFAVCRICQVNLPSEENLIFSPCHCKGSLAYVHLSCLEKWLDRSCRRTCELCGYSYKFIRRKRYKFCEGLKVWLNARDNQTEFRTDLIILLLLTVSIVCLFTLCLSGMDFFLLEGLKLGIGRNVTRASICLLLSIVLLGYFGTLYLLVRDQVQPWYEWWTHTADLRIDVKHLSETPI